MNRKTVRQCLDENLSGLYVTERKHRMMMREITTGGKTVKRKISWSLVLACVLILALAGICVLGRVFGHGTMEFYPRMDAVFTGVSGAVLYIAFAVLALFPSILEMKEKLTWRCCGLTD